MEWWIKEAMKGENVVVRDEGGRTGRMERRDTWSFQEWRNRGTVRSAAWED